MSDNELASKIKLYRKDSGFTLEQLAEKLDISLPFMQSIEAGKLPSIKLLIALSDVLSVQPGELLDSKILNSQNLLLPELKCSSLNTTHTVTEIISSIIKGLDGNSESIEKHVGTRIGYYRDKANLTRKELASKVGMSVDQLGKIESGTKFTTLKNLILIAENLEISIDYLLQDECIQSNLAVLAELLIKAKIHLEPHKYALIVEVIKTLIQLFEK